MVKKKVLPSKKVDKKFRIDSNLNRNFLFKIFITLFITVALMLIIDSFYLKDSVPQLSPADSSDFLYPFSSLQQKTGTGAAVTEKEFCVDIEKLKEGVVLFDEFGENFEIYLTKVDEREDGTADYVANDGSVLFVVDGEALVGRINVPNSDYVYSLVYFIPRTDGRYSRATNRACEGLAKTKIVQTRLDSLPPIDGEGILPGDVIAQPKGQPLALMSGDIVPIDILFVYTPAAKILAGGNAAMELKIREIMLEMNTIQENSETITRFREVHTSQVNYVEAGSYQTDMNRLSGNGDGYMDNVHTLRAQYGADIVVFLGDIVGACGYANVLGPFSVNKFDPGCFSISVVSHEVGHNQGMCHAPGDGSCSGAVYSYSHGHRFIGNLGTEWKTVMAYSPGSFMPYFSNPSISYDGVPTGLTQRDNALTADNTAGIVSNWATCQYNCETSTPYNIDASDGLRDYVEIVWEAQLSEGYTYDVYRNQNCWGNPIAEDVVEMTYRDYTSVPEENYVYAVKSKSIMGESYCSSHFNELTVGFDSGYSIENNECGEGHQDHGDGTCTAIIYSDEGDGYVLSSSDDWNFIHDYPLGEYPSYFGILMGVFGDYSQPNDLFFIRRGFMSFDTAAIPNNMDIQDAKLYLNTHNKGGGELVLLESTRTNFDELVRGDYDECGDTINPVSSTEYLGEININSLQTGNYKSVQLNEHGISNMNLIGKSQICIRSKLDADDIVPTANSNEFAYFYTSESNWPPYLEITYERNLCPLGQNCDPHNFYVGARSFDGIAGSNTGKIYSYDSLTGNAGWFREGQEDGDFFGHAMTTVQGGLEKYTISTAPFYDYVAPFAQGKIYAFDSATGNEIWSLEGNNDFLGGSVSSIYDITGDGFEDLLVGAYHNINPTIQNPRRVYALNGATGEVIWVTDQLILSNVLSFGKGLSGILDVTGDGVADVLVGSSQIGAVIGVKGKVYILDGSDGTILHVIEGENDLDNFGENVLSISDLNDNGYDEIVISAGSYDSGTLQNQGRVFIYDSNTLELITSFEGNDAYDNFGLQIAIVENSIGKERLIVSQYSQDNNYAGTIFSYNLETGTLLWQKSGVNGNILGYKLESIPDINDDEHEDFIAAYGITQPFFIPTKVRVYDGKTGLWIWDVEGDDVNDYFGDSVAGD